MISRSIMDNLREKINQQKKEDPFWATFGLVESPFQVADNIDAKYFYESANHEELINQLHSYIIHEEAYIYAITGLAGTGKTFTYNVFANRLMAQQKEFRTLMLSEGYTEEEINSVPVYETMRFQNTNYGDAGEKVNVPMIKKFMLQQLRPDLKALLDNLDVYYNSYHKEKVHTMWTDMMFELSRKNRVVILFIDEAQGLDLDTLRSIRLMTGINELMLKHVLTVVYVGTHDLMDKLNEDDAIKSRLNEHFLLKPLDRKETGEMIRFRLSVASKEKKTINLIPEDVIDVLFSITNGIPRNIFQKLSAAFRVLNKKHVEKDPHVVYTNCNGNSYPVLTADLFNELFSDEIKQQQANHSHSDKIVNASILKMTDHELIEHIKKMVSDQVGIFEMKVSQNAWKELISYFRNQILTIDDIVNDLKNEAARLSSRYTIQKAEKLYRAKAGDMNE
jgi:type II secretory pathway predicted ATPase ExeA